VEIGGGYILTEPFEKDDTVWYKPQRVYASVVERYDSGNYLVRWHNRWGQWQATARPEELEAVFPTKTSCRRVVV